MAIEASPQLNNLLFVLIGERLLQANEDQAYASHLPYKQLSKRVLELSDVIEQSVVGTGRALPPQVGNNYVRAMNLFVNDGGTNYLKDFADQLDEIAEGRAQTSMNITESKWQIIAELIRLLIELAIILVMSIFSGGSSAGEAAVARARSRVVILTVMDTLLKRTHLMPTLSEAFEEAFMTFAVRLAMMVAGPDGRRPKGFDWAQIAQDGAFGAFASLFHGAFSHLGDTLGKFFKNDFKNSPFGKDFANDIAPKTVKNDLGNIGGNNSRFSPDHIVRDLGRDSRDFVAEGGSEALAEFLGSGLFTGNWSTSWDTFLGAGISGKVENTLSEGAAGTGNWVRNTFGLNTPTVSGDSGGDRETTRGGSDGLGSGGRGSSGTGGSSRTGGTSETDGTSVPSTSGSGGSGGSGDTRTRSQFGSGSGSEGSSVTPPPVRTSTVGTGTDSRSETESPTTDVLTESGSTPPQASTTHTNQPPVTTQPTPAPAPTHTQPQAQTPAPTQTRPPAEHDTWRRLFDSPHASPVEHQALLDEIAEHRGGSVPSPEELDTRRMVHDRLASLPGVTVVVDDAANFGHQAAATMLMDSLHELGYPGHITVIAPESVQDRLRLLVPDAMNQRIDWQTGTFDSGSPQPASVGTGKADSLVLVAASDRLDPDPETAKNFLDFVGSDHAVVLKPYAWDGSHRLLYTRSGPDSPVTVHDWENDGTDTPPIPGSALYRFHVPTLTGPELDALITTQVGGARGEGLGALANAVRGGRADLMPVYGLHNVAAPGRASAVGALAGGVHEAGLGKPSVVLTLGDATVPFAPRHTADWLVHADLGDPDLAARIAGLGPDQVLVVNGGRLPQDVFRQVYQLGSLPAVLEGANTSNLVQLLGRPFISVLTHHTPYDRLDPDAADRLQGVTDAVVRESEWGARLEDSPGWQELQAADTAASVLRSLPAQDGGRLLTQDEMQRLTDVLPTERITDILGDDDTVRRMVDYDPNDMRQFKQQMRNPAEVVVTTDQVARLRDAVHGYRAEQEAVVRNATSGYSVAPRPEQTEVIGAAIRDSLDEGAALHAYFQGLAAQARDPRNDQVLQALNLVFSGAHTHLSAAPPTPVHTVSRGPAPAPEVTSQEADAPSPLRTVSAPSTGAPQSPDSEPTFGVVTESGAGSHSSDDEGEDEDETWYDAETGPDPSRSAERRPWLVSSDRWLLVDKVNPASGEPEPDPTTGEPAKEFRRVPYEPSTRVFREVNGTRVGLTPLGVRDWLTESGIHVPPGFVREAVESYLYRGTHDRAEVVYRPDDAARLLADLRAAAHAELQAGQDQVLDAVVETAELITDKYPPDRYFYLGLGRSPAAVVAALQASGHQAESVPLSDFRPGPGDAWSVLHDAFATVPEKPPLTEDQRRMLFEHFDEFVRPHVGRGKDILLIDYTQTGLSLFAAQHHLGQYLAERGTGAPVKALAMHQDIDTATLGKTIDAVRTPRNPLRHPLDWYFNTDRRIEWGRNTDTLPLGHDSALADNGPVLGQAFKQEAFDELAEHGSYKLLQKTPEEFGSDRPRRQHAQDATGYQALKDLISTRLAVKDGPGDDGRSNSVADPGGSNSATDPGGSESVTDVVGESGPPTPVAPPTRLVTRPVNPVGPASSGGAGPSVRTLDDRTVPDAELRRLTLTGSDGRPVGQASYTSKDWARRERRMPAVLTGDTYSDHRSDKAALVGSPHALPWHNGDATFFAGHGTATRVTLALSDGTTVQVTGKELARLLERGLDLGPKDRPIVLYSCATGRPPEHGGLPVAQHVANLTGRVVHAPSTEAGTAVDSSGRVRPILYLDSDGAPGAWAAFTPEPADDALDDLARGAGLHDGPGPADPWARTRTLQLVRTLRGAFGTGVEGSTDHPALLRGMAALDALRWNVGPDGSAARHTDGRMTPDLLRRIALDVLGLPNTATPEPTRLSAVLTAAGTARDADPGTSLDQLSVSPSPATAPATTPRSSGESSPVSDAVLDGGTNGSPEATADRPVTERIPPGGGRPGLDVLNVVGDGDCFFTSVLASAARQHPASAVRTMTVRQLRDHAADRFADSDLRDAEPMRMDPLDVLVGDLDTDTLRHVLGGVPLPALTPGQRARVDGAPAAQRARFADQHHSDLLRTRLVAELHKNDTAAREHWQRLLDTVYPRWAQAAPSLSEIAGATTGDLVERAIRDVRLWATPFFDRALPAIAGSTGLDVVVVQDGVPDHHLAEGAVGPVYVHYNGTDHYSAVALTSAPGEPSAASPASQASPKKKVHFAPDTKEGTDSGSGTDHGQENAKPTTDKPTTDKPTTDKPKTDKPKTDKPKPAFFRIDSELDTHRPPRLDRSMLPPPRTGRPVVFSDGSRLPTYLTGDGNDETAAGSYGQARVTLRGTEQVVAEIGGRTGLGEAAEPGAGEALADLERALRETPWIFHGDGYESPPFQDARGRVRVLRVTTRPHGNWERFTDGYGAPFKFDGVQRSQVTTGATKTLSTSVRIAPSFAIGPPSGGALAAYGRVGGVLGYNRAYDYGMQDQTLSQVETRMGDGSHLHLDDVQYEVYVSGPRTGVTRSGLAPAFLTGESHFTFGVRGGLSVRLSDGETSPTGAGRVPRTMTLGPSSDYRLVHTEGYGPVKEIRDWALSRVGAEPGTAAYEEIAGFFTTENFHRVADRLARDKVTTRQLLGEDPERSSQGAFVVERVVPGKAILLTESAAAEMRNTIQRAVRNERSLAKSYTQEVNAGVGPSVTFGDFFGVRAGLRAMAGLAGRYFRTTTHGSVFGGTGSRKIVGQAKKVPTDLYLVAKTVHVRKTGDARATPFTTWSLDRMTRTEARRHAGWDDGTALRRRNGNEPFAPVYLTKDDPAVLGMSRPEAFVHDDGEAVHDDPVRKDGSGAAHGGDGPERTLLDTFTDQVIRAAAREYPGTVAPLEDLGDPSDPRWHNAEHYRMALQNTLNVINTLSHHSMTGDLEALVTTGLRIGLVVPGRFTRTYRWIWIDGRLTDRRYEGTQNDLIVRSSAPGTERLDGQQNVVRGYEAGADVSVSVRDSGKDGVGLPPNIGTVAVGPRWGRQTGRRTGYGATVSFESLSIGASPSHLHSYRLELSAQSGGYWRFRNLWRGIASLGLLGTHHFVRREQQTYLVGGTAGRPVTGRVVLAVPAEHTPTTDPHTGTGTPTPARVERLDPARAKALATGDVRGSAAEHGPNPFGDHPHYPLGVGAHAELAEAAEDVMRDASGGSWHFAETGAPAHDAMLRSFQPQYLTADSDQSSGPAGSRITGLFGKGPYLNRLGALAHRMRVTNPRVVSKPAKIETEQTLGSDLQASGAVTTTQTFTVTRTGAFLHTHPVGPSVAGSYGIVSRKGRLRARTHNVNRTVTADINPVDESHKVLVVGDTQHDIAGAVRADGLLSPLHSLVTWTRDHWSGRRLTFAADWLGHLSEKTAHRVGLLRDRMGEVPRYAAKAWSQPRWLRDNPFGSYPVNSLDTTEVLADFDRELRGLGIDDASRDRVHSLVTPRAVRALREQLTSTGAAARTRVGGPGWRSVRVGGRTAALKVELVADEPRFDGLGHSAVLKDGRHATETDEDTVTSGHSKALGVNVGEAVRTGDPVARAAGPTYGEVGSSTQQTTSSRSTARWRSNIFYANEPYAEYLTGYTLRLTLDLGGDRIVRAEGPVGRLREQLPLSLSVPETGTVTEGPLAAPELSTPAPSVTVWAPGGDTLKAKGEALRKALDEWRTIPRPDGAGKPFRKPPVGFDVRRIAGLTGLRAAGDLAIARAYGASAGPTSGQPRDLSGDDLDTALRQARRTPLTRPGTASALALHDGTGNASLAAFFGDSTTDDGFQVAGLTEDSFVGGAQGEYRLYSRPDFTGAQLLAVAPDATMESAERDTVGGDTSVARSGAHDPALGGGPLLATGTAGTAALAASGSEATAAETDAARLGGAEGAQITLKPKTGRAFLFAIPTSWVGVAEVERSFKDSRAGAWLGEHLGPFGHVKPGPQAVEAETRVIAWVREDVARELGLVSDDTFPSRVADAWGKVTKASGAWVAADNAYWKQRRAMPDARDRYQRLKRELTAAKGELSSTPDAEGARRRVREVTAGLRAARRELHQRWTALREGLAEAEAAAAEFHRVRAETDRLTRWHRLPAERRAAVAEPAPVAFDPPPAKSKTQPTRYTAGSGTLVSPSGATYTLRDVPSDGDAFYHALAEGLHHADPELLADQLPVTERQALITGMRELLADRLRDQDNADLLAFTAPDTADTFGAADLLDSGVAFDEGTPERREYEDTGHLPLHAVLPDDQRGGLAAAQLRRSGAAKDEAGWDHGAADVLPALAARTFGVRVSVVRGDGTFQEFVPLDTKGPESAPPDARTPGEDGADGLQHVVLHLKDRHFQLAVPDAGGPAPDERPPLPAPAAPQPHPVDEPPAPEPEQDEPAAAASPRPAHRQVPWTDTSSAAGTGRYGITAADATLTAPDGTVHVLVEPSGDGNGFWSALASALHPDRGRDPVALVQGRPLPSSVRLDRRSPFTHAELERAGVTLGSAQAEEFRRDGGRLPDGVRLTASQERTLIRTQLHTPRHWDDGSARAAAELAATAHRATIVVVSEDGTFQTHTPADAVDGRTVTLYRRGAEYLLARPTAPHTPVAEEPTSQPLTENGGQDTDDDVSASAPDDLTEADLTDAVRERLNAPALMDTSVTREDVDGLDSDAGAAIAWNLVPSMPLREAGLDDLNRARLVLRKPDLDPELATALGRRLADSDPDPVRVLWQPGYATGDQFGIAAALIADENLHVAVITGIPGREQQDKGPAVHAFYLDSGIPARRVHLVPLGNDKPQKAAEAKAAEILGRKLTAKERKTLVIPVGSGTTWIGRNFGVDVRRKVRGAWRLDDAGFPVPARTAVGNWLAGRDIHPSRERDTVVLWSRFSGKKGDVHVEHDTGYQGIRQILTRLREEGDRTGRHPLVVIAGDAHADPGHAHKYPDMVRELREEGLDVHDLTNFWVNDKAGTTSWGGDSRTGQMRLYEYLRRDSRTTRHLGFRSGNLEALALAGHGVRYMEEPDSEGGERMEKWHAAQNSLHTATGGLAPGYERLPVTAPPTRSGKFLVGLRTQDGGHNPAPDLKRPPWVYGAPASRAEKPAELRAKTKGFAVEDLDRIIRYLLGPETGPVGSVGSVSSAKEPR
ncbi:hypothetical protein ACFYRG_06620 [Streptomyces mirabilis]|uniref:hypothetical protein n=1 Tax=Streptomyces mirabilis TaxID=68239 RepID=UPI0036B7D2AD